jgi:hypothetical protein
MPAALMAARNSRRMLAASTSFPSLVAKTGPAFLCSRCCRSAGAWAGARPLWLE